VAAVEADVAVAAVLAADFPPQRERRIVLLLVPRLGRARVVAERLPPDRQPLARPPHNVARVPVAAHRAKLQALGSAPRRAAERQIALRPVVHQPGTSINFWMSRVRQAARASPAPREGAVQRPTSCKAGHRKWRRESQGVPRPVPPVARGLMLAGPEPLGKT
jgi:hypothetical protein